MSRFRVEIDPAILAKNDQEFEDVMSQLPELIRSGSMGPIFDWLEERDVAMVGRKLCLMSGKEGQAMMIQVLACFGWNALIEAMGRRQSERESGDEANPQKH